MKVKQLLKELSKADPSFDVILSSDPEGNHFSILEDVVVDNIGYTKDEGEIWLTDRELTEELVEQGIGAEDVNPKAKKCIVLWP